MKKLGIRSGNLFRSFQLGNANTLTKIDTANERGISVTIGSNLVYSGIQNEGGFIKATPISKGRSKFKMESYFWGMFRQYNNIFHKIMALSVRAKGGITIRATRYFDKSEKTFVEKYENRMLNDLVNVFSQYGDPDKIQKNLANIMKNFATKVPNFFLLALAQNMTDRGKENPKKTTWVD